MATTIQVSDELLEELKRRKMFSKESYEEIIWDIIEDSKELSRLAREHLKQAEEDIRQGRIYTHEQAKSELGL